MKTARTPKPKWLRVKLPSTEQFAKINEILKENDLHTVCNEAFCPNREKCWHSGTATFLLMGPICTRNCKFCDVKTGNPKGFLDPNEPENLAKAVKRMKLKYVVLTEVTRDDLADGGSLHLKKCIEEIKKINDDIIVEILIPDFQGNDEAIQNIISAKPNVIGHNIEVVESLTSRVRDKRASFQQSLKVLKKIKEVDPNIITKSSLMVGLGETDSDIIEAFDSLLEANVDILTIGQYLQPNKKCLPVIEYYPPEKFEEWRQIALKKGFASVVAGPLVRSSYQAAEVYYQLFGQH